MPTVRSVFSGCILVLSLALMLSACGDLLSSTGSEPATPPETTEPTPEPPTPTPEPTPITLGATLQFEAGQFQLNHPQDWYTSINSNTLAMAANEDAIRAASPGDDLVILIDATTLDHVTGVYTDDVTTTLANLFMTSSEGPAQAGYTVGEAVPITVGNKQALIADLSATGGAGQLLVILAPPNVIRVLGQAAPDAWTTHQAAFNKIIESITFVDPTPAPTPTPELLVAQPVVTTHGLPGLLLRVGGNEGPPEARFVSARGLDAGPDGVVYLAESGQGVWVFAPDGTLISVFGKQQELLLDAYDVALGPNGDVFVADYGRNAIARFSPGGSLVRRWGEVGEGQHQFGLQSPQRIAVGADGHVYALDSRINPATQNTVSSIVRFNGDDGSFVQRIDLPSGSAPNDLAVDQEGSIYLADATSGAVIKMNTSGQVLAQFGSEIAPDGITAGALDIDKQGNIYVATWSEGILKLNPMGELLARGGAIVESGTVPRPGQFSLPNGIAAAPGDVVWVSDNTGEYSAITAIRLFTDTSAYAEATEEMSATMIISDSGVLRQWAVEATASSSYGEEYAPDGATGPPNVKECTDSPDAWAPATPNTLETLELTYDAPVFATQVNVHQNHQPGFVTQVELKDERGEYSVVYTAEPELNNTCPAVLEVSFDPSLLRVAGVRLTIDQRADANWAEIDAVELIGVP